MKIYLQTQTLSADADDEAGEGGLRGRQLVYETPASPAAVETALQAIVASLGAITAIPAPAHEHNLKQLLPRDLAAQGLTAGPGGEGEALLSITRLPDQPSPSGVGTVIALRYAVHVQA